MHGRRPDLLTTTQTWLPICLRRRRRWARIRGSPSASCHEHPPPSKRCLCRADRANPNGWRVRALAEAPVTESTKVLAEAPVTESTNEVIHERNVGREPA